MPVSAASSAEYRGRDPSELMERSEMLQQFDVAKRIFRLPEGQWESRLQLLPPDQRPTVRAHLELLKEYRQCRQR